MVARYYSVLSRCIHWETKNCNLSDLSALTYTRGYKYKLYKQQSSVNIYKYFFNNRICDIWNALPVFCVLGVIFK